MTRPIAFFLLLFCPVLAPSQSVWLHDDFGRSTLGATWKAVSGDWKIEDSTLKVRAQDYDELLASEFYVYSTQPFSFEVTLRGARAGIYFNLDAPSSKTISQMVRFDDKSILTGFFDAAGEYTATNTFDSPRAPTDWITLRVDVDPPTKRYQLYVDGVFVGSDTSLMFTSGYVGLQASDGLCEFKSVRIYSSGPQQDREIPSIGSKITFQHLEFVRPRGGDLLVYDTELKRMLQIDGQGTLLSIASPSAQPPVPTVVTIGRRQFSIVKKHILISTSNGTVTDSITDRLVAPCCLASDSERLYVADPGAEAIFEFSRDGRILQTIDASVIGGFKVPRGIAVFGKKRIVIADYDKLVFWDEESSKPPVVNIGPDSHTCRIYWSTNSARPVWLEFASDAETVQHLIRLHYRAPGEPSVELRDLTPLTRYSYRYSPALKTIPESCSVSKMFRFATPPADPRMMSFTRLPVMCMVYRTMSFRDKYPCNQFPQIPDGRTLTDDDLSYLKRATEFNREFYFRNSGCKIVLDFDFYVVEDTLWLHEVGDSDPYWLSPTERVARDFERAARSFGKRPDEYAGLICPYAWINYPPRRASALRDPSKKDSLSIRQAVGGGTYGVPAPWKYGKTAGYTANPFQDRFSRQDWLITHEFHHQIDALMDVSGYPEYYHADQPWKMPGRFGEDFDFNAHIIRNAEKSRWLTLRFGTLSETLNADHDGVPDNDPSLPFDEKRLGGNPQSQDTDGDGVRDLDEVMMGTSHGSALNDPDTDGDGLPDDIDPEPLYPINPNIPKVRSLTELDLHPFGSVKDSAIAATFYLAWTDSALLLSAVTNKPANFLFQIDANNDGWFHGFDNFQIRVLNNGDSARVADYYLRDCSSWVNPPKDRRDILRRADLGLSCQTLVGDRGHPGTLHRLDLVIPRSDQYGFQLRKGKRFSIRLGVQTSTDLWMWDELFERNYMMQVELH